MSQHAAGRARVRGALRLAAVAAALLALYALAGFLFAPWLAQREIPRLVEQNLHQRARIGELSFNPFTLRLHAREFALDTFEGRPLLGFADAMVDLSWNSLLRRAWVLDEVQLTDPALHLEIAKDGRLNLAALAPDAGTGKAAQPPRFALGHLSVTNGSIDFEDQREAYRNRLERLSVDLRSLSSLDSAQGSYLLAGQTAQGAKLQWKGGVALAPLAATGTLAVENLPLAQLTPYLNEYTMARIAAGQGDLELPYALALTEGRPRFSVNGAKIELRGLALDSAGKKGLQAHFGTISLAGLEFDSLTQSAVVKAARIGPSTFVSGKDKRPLASTGPIAIDAAALELATRRGSVRALALASAEFAAGEPTKPRATLRALAVDGIAFDLESKHGSAKRMRVAGLGLALERDANGDLDLLRAFSNQGGDAPGGAKPAKWQASIAAVEIGSASVRYTDHTAKKPLALSADGLSGSFGLNAAAGSDGVRVRVDAGNFTLAKLDALAGSAAAASAPQPALKFAQLSLNGARYDSGANALEAAALRAGSFGLDTSLENGRLSVLDLLPAGGKSRAARPLSARVQALELGEGRVNFADPARRIALALERVALKLSDVSNDGTKPLAFRLSADVKSGGRIALRGSGVPAQGTLEAKIEASSVALAPAQSVLAQFAHVKLTSGDVSLSGTLRAGAREAKLGYSGRASVVNLALEDAAGVRLFGWKSLATESLKATLSPDRIDIDELRLTAPAGRFAIAKDGTSNISRAFAKNEPAAEASAAHAAAPAARADAKAQQAQPGAADTFVIAVRRVRVDQGALDFSDDSLSPGYVAKIYDLAGTANGLSSNPEARSQFTLEGRVDEFGYAHLSGTVNPFAPRNRSTFRVQLRNIDLVTATPYAVRFAGYRIASGRLTLDLNYRVRDSLIEGNNKITLEQFTLGERVDSPDALKLPFELAVNLLKDPDGRITIEVPLKGNLDDPQFSLAPLIWKAVGHFIGNIIAAPFRALAHLFGGSTGEDLGAIAFDPGKAKLLPPEREKLARVVAALAKHPELKLVIPTHYDTEADARAMKRAALGRDIGRRAGFAVSEDEEPGPVNIEDRQTRKALRTIFAERFSKAELDRLRAEAEARARSAGAPAPSLTTRLRNFASGEPQLVDTREFHQTLLRRLRESQTLPADALAELAQKRALAIEAALQAAGADSSRIERTTAAPTADAQARQITVHLLLATR